MDLHHGSDQWICLLDAMGCVKMATEKWLIDGKALVENFRRTKMDEVFPNWKELSPTTQAAIIRLTTKYRAIILSAPIVDAVEVVHGEWVSDEGDVLFHCSECETQISTSWDYDDLRWNYCPECGAKMDGDGNG